MGLSYFNLLNQIAEFPTEEFKIENNTLLYHTIPLIDLIKKYGSPLRISYLPKISERIQFAKRIFTDAMKDYHYDADYLYCYCTKSSHFSFIIEEGLKNNIHLETSSEFDMQILKKIYQKKLISKENYIICNGFKKNIYSQHISDFINDGFSRCIPVLDNMNELDFYEARITGEYKVGIRVATTEEPNFSFYSSRLGIRPNAILEYYKNKMKNKNSKGKLFLLHFFINTGVRDSAYYWTELAKFIELYCQMKNVCPELKHINIGGGFPIKTNLKFYFNYAQITHKIIKLIKEICDKHNVPPPHIFTEFGSYTVGESGVTIFSVLEQKLQNDTELWYMIDGSFMTHLPDIWGIDQKFIVLPINNWQNEYKKVNLGGITCDSADFYNSESGNRAEIYLPAIHHNQKMYVGFFNTGAYQDSIGGIGGIHHCLVPCMRHVIINTDATGNISTSLFREEQSSESVLNILGYNG
ncbi:MAG: arginine decarboxylase [Chitinophagaceae bacterium]|nr:arginine decarboxylase [Chitinophagaceae bacterium]